MSMQNFNISDNDKKGCGCLLIILVVGFIAYFASSNGNEFERNHQYVTTHATVGSYSREDAKALTHSTVNHSDRDWYQMMSEGRAKMIPTGTRVTFITEDIGFAVVSVEGEPYNMYIPMSALGGE